MRVPTKPVRGTSATYAKAVGNRVRKVPDGEPLGDLVETTMRKNTRPIVQERVVVPQALDDIGRGTLARRARLLGSVFPEAIVPAAIARVASTAKPRYAKALARLPFSELSRALDPEVERIRRATKAELPRIVKRIANVINELTGAFHPEVMARLATRAQAVRKAVLRHPTFVRHYELLDEDPTLVFGLRAAGRRGSRTPSLLFVDARGVMRVRRKKDGRIFFLRLGDVQVKSTNVGELVDQFLSDQAHQVFRIQTTRPLWAAWFG